MVLNSQDLRTTEPNPGKGIARPPPGSSRSAPARGTSLVVDLIVPRADLIFPRAVSGNGCCLIQNHNYCRNACFAYHFVVTRPGLRSRFEASS